MSLPDLYAQMHEEVFSTEHPGFPSQKWPSWSIPSERTFKAYWTKLKSPKQREQAKSGDHNFNLKSRAKLGKAISNAYAAGRIGELDATIWPIELVGEGPGAPIIGPAVVFRIRCKDTGQLLGLSISLENASWNGAAQAIACCLEDKREFCRRIGIDLDALGVPWDVVGLPAQIDADQGETYNTKPKRFVRLTGVHIVNMPGGRGDLKPGVEGDWHVLQVRLCNKTPGALIKQFEDEHGIKWHMKGSMTISEFLQMLVMEEIKYMHRTRKHIKLTARMIEDGLNTSPHAMFKWSERKGGGGLRRHERTPVLLSLLSVDTASVTEFGLTFRGVHYACNTLHVAQAYDDARMRGRWKVDVAYDPLNAGRIWLIRGDKDAPTEYVEATISLNYPNQLSYVDKTWHEVQSLMQATGVADHEHRAVTDEAFREIDRRQAELAEKSKQRVAEQRALYPMSEAALIAGRKDARTEEKYRTSPATAVSNQIPSATAPATPPAGPLQGPGAAVRPIAEVFKFPAPASRPGNSSHSVSSPLPQPQKPSQPLPQASSQVLPSLAGSPDAGMPAPASGRKQSRLASLAASLGMGEQPSLANTTKSKS